MAPREHLLFGMKKALLEYGLKNNLEFLVSNIACHLRTRFSDYKIHSIRFELFNLYLMMKNKEFKRFDSLIHFLNEFNINFPNIISDLLFVRVLASLKALHIYECLRVGDLKRTCHLIKEYFPLNCTYIFDSPVDYKNKGSKSFFELRILKMRTHWNELILDQKKREEFFLKKFSDEFDNGFHKFLLSKVLEIIREINEKLPPTIIEQVILNGFKDSHLFLFGSDDLKLELEDEVRVELFLDNLKLHQLYMESKEKVNKKKIFCSKYLKRLLNLVNQWDTQFHNIEANYNLISQEPGSNDKVIKEILYLDSQMENFKIFSQSLEISEDLEENSINKESHTDHQSNEDIKSSDQNSSEFSTASSSLKEPTFLPSFQTTTKRNKNKTNQINELITDDERDPNLSL